MTYADRLIEDSIKKGHSFLILEPREVFAPSVMELHPTEKRLVYKVDILLACLSEEYDWDAVESLEWFDYNIMSLTHMAGGPIFYDEFSENYLTIDD
jgi:hypothetical protein|tara:strand:- start:982 stop:1272 length:291 start_codon:yes stop_codon:yes gene_type:complete